MHSLDRSNAFPVRPFYAAAGAAGRLVVAGVVLAGIIQAAGVLTHPAAAETLRITDGATRCAAAPQQRTMWQDLEDGVVCRVTAFGRVPAAAPAMFYQLQAYHAPGSDPGSAAALAEAGAGAVLLSVSSDGRTLQTLGGWSGSGAVVEPPRIVSTSQGRILVLPMTATVSSHPTDDVVFRALRGRWVQVSTDGWWKGVHSPRDSEQRNGSAMDWPTLRAYGAFWRRQDPECCPTGGSYIAQLRLNGASLHLAHIRYARGELTFP